MKNAVAGLLIAGLSAALAPSVADERPYRRNIRYVAELPMDASGNLRVRVNGIDSFRFVGVTTRRFAGDGTFAAMTTACHEEYPGSRMAFSDEYVLSFNPAPVPEIAWIQPRVAFGEFTPGTPGLYFDRAGQQVDARQTCNGWTDAGDEGYYRGTVLLTTGLAISHDYGEARNLCSVERPVACVARE